MDSRTGPELLFDAGLGELFSIRIAGNVLNKEILGSLEFAAAEAGISLIFVMGHTRCAAISGAWSNMQLGHFTSLLNDIRPALDAAGKMEAAQDQEHFLDRASELHVKLTLDRIRKESRILTDLEKQGRLEICGGCYDVKTGKVRFL